MTAHFVHDMPFGARLIDTSHTRFRLWAPDCDQVELLVEGEAVIVMERDDSGMFESDVRCGAGTAYHYRINDQQLVPDPASRLQSFDVHDPSLVCDPAAFTWRHDNWRGRPWHEMVIYELHAGCLGGFEKVRQLLPGLAAMGITAIEIMPLADFSGSRNWGYDGVLPFAPDTSYGTPDQLKNLIDSAHGCGMCVYLDVVYNHFGPDGNYLHCYASRFFHPHQQSPWGAAIDFSQPQVREFFIQNALYWLLEYRFDGLRVDAAHQISDPGWLDEMATRVRSAIEPGRHVHLMLENELNCSAHLEAGFDAQWNDDGHNVLHVMLTGEHHAYYQDFSVNPATKLARCLAEGFVYQGEPSPLHQQQPRGTPSAHLPPSAFILFLQNHDQIGNRAFGERLHQLTNAEALRAAITLQLLCPQIPLLFMGEETACRTPFLFFTDFHNELASAVREGRQREFAALPAFGNPALRALIPDPNAMLTYIASMPNPEAHPEQTAHYSEFYRALLSLRHQYIIPHLPDCRSLGAGVIEADAVFAQWQLGSSILTILINLGARAILVDSAMVKGRLLADSQQLWSLQPDASNPALIPARSTRVYLQATGAST